MLCLVGDKYSAHLWPMIELFCWLSRHGKCDKVDGIEIKALGQESLSVPASAEPLGESSSVQAKVRPELARGLYSFSVRRARCDDQQQRQVLLSCLESGFRDHRAFERVIHSLFKELVGTERRRGRSLVEAESTVRTAPPVRMVPPESTVQNLDLERADPVEPFGMDVVDDDKDEAIRGTASESCQEQVSPQAAPECKPVLAMLISDEIIESAPPT